jgi:hypothetical protein
MDVETGWGEPEQDIRTIHYFPSMSSYMMTTMLIPMSGTVRGRSLFVSEAQKH